MRVSPNIIEALTSKNLQLRQMLGNLFAMWQGLKEETDRLKEKTDRLKEDTAQLKEDTAKLEAKLKDVTAQMNLKIENLFKIVTERRYNDDEEGDDDDEEGED